MTTHLEDKSKSGIARRPYTADRAYRHAAGRLLDGAEHNEFPTENP